MKYKAIICENRDSICHIILNRPDCGNAIDGRICEELLDVCQKVGRDDSISVVVIKGAGGTFSSGAGKDIAFLADDAIEAVAGLEKAVIALIDGDAMSEGLELALACDIRIATEKARFGMLQIDNDYMPACGGTQRLPRLVGSARAMQMILTAETIDAAEAFRTGLVSKVVSSRDIEKETLSLAEGIAGQGPIALRFVKEAINKGMDLTIEQGLRLEADLYFLIQTSDDRMEGIRSFLEKRPPQFKNK